MPTKPARPAPAAQAKPPAKMRYRKATAIASLVPEITQKAFEKYGFSTATLLTDWKTIVGPELAAYTFPEKLKWPKGVRLYQDSDSNSGTEFGGDNDQKGRPGATLVLRVDGPRAVEIQYKATQIMERINAYFGYRAVAEMRVLQAPLSDQIADADDASGYRKLDPPQSPPPEVATIENEDLRQALALMAAGIERQRKMGKKG